MLISPRLLYRIRSHNRNQRFLHSRDRRTYNCRWGWRSLDMRKARSFLTKLSRNRHSPMFQLRIWKPWGRFLQIEPLPRVSGCKQPDLTEQHHSERVTRFDFPGSLIRGSSGAVEIAGGQRTQCRGWTSFCQAFPPKAERFRRRAADNRTARSNPQ